MDGLAQFFVREALKAHRLEPHQQGYHDYPTNSGQVELQRIRAFDMNIFLVGDRVYIYESYRCVQYTVL